MPAIVRVRERASECLCVLVMCVFHRMKNDGKVTQKLQSLQILAFEHLGRKHCGPVPTKPNGQPSGKRWGFQDHDPAPSPPPACPPAISSVQRWPLARGSPLPRRGGGVSCPAWAGEGLTRARRVAEELRGQQQQRLAASLHQLRGVGQLGHPLGCPAVLIRRRGGHF